MSAPRIRFGWLAAKPLVLASGSATRRDMLEAAGLPVEIVRPDIDERAVEAPMRAAGATAATRARLLARAKALAVAEALPDRLVLAADQTLEAEGHPGVKAGDSDEAARFLARLSGRRHVLHSAAALAEGGRLVVELAEEAHLWMRPLTPDYIRAYVAALGAGALSSVGGYQIEGIGAQLFDRIAGDQATILGLPLLPVLAALRRRGALL